MDDSMFSAASASAKAEAELTAALKDLDPERADLLKQLARNRRFLLFTTRGLTDEQARQRPTVSELSLGGLIKHVAGAERTWYHFITEGPAAAPDYTKLTPEDWARYADYFRLLPDETLQGALDEYAKVAAATDELVRTLPDLNVAHPLPNAPWFPPGETWTARRVLLHIIAETAQHAGHADIIRESLDGQKSMG